MVSVAGIPLTGVRLNVLLAGMERILEYGIMQARDNNIWTRGNGEEKEQKLDGRCEV